MLHQGSFRIAVVAPTFNNAKTLARVLHGIDATGVSVIVVDDGCTDATAQILRDWQAAGTVAGMGRHVVRHEINQGKAQALRSGFAKARQLGFTHALTFDTDAQLDTAEIPGLLRLAQQYPWAIIAGCRNEHVADYPTASRLGRRISNRLVCFESGAHVSDTQCGFRVYPLQALTWVSCRAGRYALETEVLTRWAWAGLGIVETPVSCRYEIPEGLVSHFRPWRDVMFCAGMHLRLIARSLFPWPVQRAPKASDLGAPGQAETGTIWRRFIVWVSPARAWREARQNPAQRSRFAAGLAAGVFIANLPCYGLQTLLSLYAARRLRLPPLAVVVGSHMSTPPVGPVLIALGIAVGHLLTHGSWPAWRSFDPSPGYGRLLRTLLVEWIVGGVVCGAVLAAGTFLFTRAVLHWLPSYTPEDSEADPTAAPPTPDRASA